MDLLTVSLVVIVLVIGAALGYLLGFQRGRSAQSVELAEARTAQRLLSERAAALEADARLATEVTAAVGPLSAGVRALQQSVGEQDRARLAQLTRLDEQITQLARRSAELQQSTQSLFGALSSTAQRGDWGEVQLRRIVEYAGMLEHVDFDAQLTARTTRATVRPDMVIHLPGGGTVVIDAKAPLSSRLTEHGTEADHATALLRHVNSLAGKEYWTAFDVAPQFVVCFVPTDGLLSAACAAEPDLVERALSRNVVLSSPSTLLVLLKTVALNWRQYELSSSAQEIIRLGKQLYERVGNLSGGLRKVGTSLEKAVAEYNTFVGSFENRFLVTARRLSATGVADSELEVLDAVSAAPRGITAEELAVQRQA